MWQAVDATRHLLLVRFGEVISHSAKPNAKFIGHQNCAVKFHRDSKPEYGKLFLKQLQDARAKDSVYSCRCTYVHPKLSNAPEGGIAKPAYWRVDDLVLEGKL